MNDKTKVLVAVICLAVAGAAVAWQMGVFDSGPKGAVDTNANADVDWNEEEGNVRIGTNEDGRSVQSLGAGGNVRID